MARLFRCVFVFVLVFGLFSVFSLGVNATEQQENSYETYAPVVVPSDPNDANHSGKYKWTVDLNTPKYGTGEYILDDYNVCDFDDIGYTVIDKLWSYSSSSKVYKVVRFIDAPMPTFYVSNGAEQLQMEWKYPASKSVAFLYMDNCSMFAVGLGKADSNANRPVLKAGDRYLIYIMADVYLSGGSYSTNWTIEQNGKFEVISEGKGNGFSQWWEIEPSVDIWASDIRMVNNFSTTKADISLYAAGAKNITSYSNVEDAIRDQTDDMNKNHDETMDKIDDVTDFDEQEQSDLTGAVDGASDQINEKLGILSFGDHVLDQFIGIFDAAAGSPGITLPGFSIKVDGVQHVVWTDQVFDLSTIEDKFGSLMTAVHFATSFLVYAALVMYVQKIFGAIMQDWSDK